MSPHVLLFLCSSVYIAVLLVTPTNGSDDYKHTPDELEKEIKKQTKIQEALNASLANVTTILKVIDDKYSYEIKSLEVLKNVTSEVERQAIEELKQLYKNITTLLDKEKDLNTTLYILLSRRIKYEYGLKWIAEDFMTLNARRNSGDDLECYKIDGENYLGLVGRSNQNKTKDLIILLEDELQQLLAENADLISRIAYINSKIEFKMVLSENRIEKLKTIINSYYNNFNKTEEDIETFKKDIEGIGFQIARLTEAIFKEEQVLKKYYKEVTERRREYVYFYRADRCYKRVEKDILNPIKRE